MLKQNLKTSLTLEAYNNEIPTEDLDKTRNL